MLIFFGQVRASSGSLQDKLNNGESVLATRQCQKRISLMGAPNIRINEEMSGSNTMFFPRSCSCGLHKLPLMNLLFITDNVSSQSTEFLLVAILVLFIS